jgi:hypothetical protein
MFLREPMTAEAAARAGYDYVVVDMQHGIASESEMLAMIQATEAAGAIPVVRVAHNDATSIGRALDSGALAVIAPMVNDSESARRAVAACRYAPVGSRSYGPVAAISRYSDDYAQIANQTVACIVMIETKEAVERIDSILPYRASTASTWVRSTCRSRLACRRVQFTRTRASPRPSARSSTRASGMGSCPEYTPTRPWPQSGAPQGSD